MGCNTHDLPCPIPTKRWCRVRQYKPSAGRAPPPDTDREPRRAVTFPDADMAVNSPNSPAAPAVTCYGMSTMGLCPGAVNHGFRAQAFLAGVSRQSGTADPPRGPYIRGRDLIDTHDRGVRRWSPDMPMPARWSGRHHDRARRRIPRSTVSPFRLDQDPYPASPMSIAA